MNKRRLQKCLRRVNKYRAKDRERLFELFEDGAIIKHWPDQIAGYEKTKAELEIEIEKCKVALAYRVNMV